jgi:hypothetical protein
MTWHRRRNPGREAIAARIGLLLSAVLATALVWPAPATHAAATAGERVMVGTRQGAAVRAFGRPAERPRRLAPRKRVSIVRVRWRRWGSKVALGRGRVRVKCARRCRGRRVRKAGKARVRLSRLRAATCAGSRVHFYTRARIGYGRRARIRRRQVIKLQARASACPVPGGPRPESVPGGAQPSFPIRAAFYYPWFPETWTVNGSHVFYQPAPLGYYDSSSRAVVDQHLQALDWARFEAAIASWWGPGTHKESTRLPLLLDRTQALGSPLKWALYYECEGSGAGSCPAGPDPSPAQIRADLAHASRYAAHPSYLRIGGRPVVFVYSAGDASCDLVSRWRAAAPDWYVVLKLFSGYRDCAVQPDRWHQYGPASATSHHAGNSFAVSPGFWRADEPSPRLAREPGRFAQNVREMVASGAPFQLVTTFNEWGEGTAVESASEWSSGSGYGIYLDLLRSDGR